jgi:capsule synthesis protein PGA_cap
MIRRTTAYGAPELVLWQAKEAEKVATRLAVAGDFLPAGKLSRRANESWRDLAVPLLPHFADISTTFANLECNLGVDGLSPKPLNGIGQIVCALPSVLDYLDAFKCQNVGIANNHAFDFGPEGIKRTRNVILDAGKIPLGAGFTLKDAPEIAIWRGPGNLCVGFWSAAKASHELATRKAVGVEPATRDRAREAIEEMKRKGVTFCVALVHAGCIRSNRPAPEDVELLRALARSGFQLIAASHSHRIAGFEIIEDAAENPAFCFHGLGSLVSGYIASDFEREGLIVIAGFDTLGKLAEVSARPVYLPEGGIGQAASQEHADIILGRFKSLTNEIADGSCARAFYGEISPGLLKLYFRDARAALLESGIRGLAHKVARVRIHHVKRLMHRVFAT